MVMTVVISRFVKYSVPDHVPSTFTYVNSFNSYNPMTYYFPFTYEETEAQRD